LLCAPGLVEYEDLVFLWKIRDLGAIILLLATFFITGTHCAHHPPPPTTTVGHLCCGA
jgi:hypothetical protein